MNNKKQYYKLDDIGYVGTQAKSHATNAEKKAISAFIKADKMKNAHLKTTKNTSHTRLAKSA